MPSSARTHASEARAVPAAGQPADPFPPPPQADSAHANDAPTSRVNRDLSMRRSQSFGRGKSKQPSTAGRRHATGAGLPLPAPLSGSEYFDRDPSVVLDRLPTGTYCPNAMTLSRCYGKQAAGLVLAPLHVAHSGGESLHPQVQRGRRCICAPFGSALRVPALPGLGCQSNARTSRRSPANQVLEAGAESAYQAPVDHVAIGCEFRRIRRTRLAVEL